MSKKRVKPLKLGDGDKAAVRVVNKIAGCTDTASCRYALSTVRVNPMAGHEDAVWLTATDGRCMAVTPANGIAEEEHLMPSDLVKTPGTKGVICHLNGHWRNDNGRWADSDVDGRYPNTAKIELGHEQGQQFALRARRRLAGQSGRGNWQ